MSGPQTFLLAVLAVLVVQRLLELWHARRNEQWLRQHGAVELGADHYGFIVALHTAFLPGLAVEGFLRGPQLHPYWPVILALLLTAQALRYWCLATLGRFWNTKILVIPAAPLIKRGPYRWCKHPNYGVVIAEIFFIPLLFQAWWTLITASLINLALLRVRIAVENKALACALQDDGNAAGAVVSKG
ncbi:MAG: isoprenylcysteine carboxyl methyltransferase [candidate division KSB1 bacterium]|nr:isoprenylcysteine carboxyl methyltransferase [candidate division KSB1 bacterium]MDZ7275869.1 isoprenylcysteine carboxyl methyltransferase [candidate division KSB1 bacterium]MDZ7287619.1 isoprenylcysteine carboxyl methyltransferase [candidate division KSB1 bacterium]MDZ7309449.1 isoprenylcysteine carboxyl methyltransferase [candidate division KSB1 bacterium]MDZ7350597.1 isoprenylcysteine carboxyl methyltransferase [candidate division KSB1 bacterium]